MEAIKDILKEKFKNKGPVYAKHEFQEYGIWLSSELHDPKHKGLYIKLAKNKLRPLLEEARVFASGVDSKSVNRGRLFMWKIQELEKEENNKK